MMILVLTLTVGCATNWDALIGSYTYRDAVQDYGVPEGREVMPNGDYVVSWVTNYVRHWIDKVIMTFGSDDRLKSGKKVRL